MSGELLLNRRRFIAGVVCPRCSQMDKMVVDLDTDHRECVACGFTEARPAGDPAAGDPAAGVPAAGVAAAGPPIAEIPTRVSRGSARRVETPAEAVTLLDPRAGKKDA